ncbi:MAG: glycosyltransferase [Alphaproteobacteria bacterium]|nr:glycosyltransferase [Alphaproteobacteria bacterium]
MSKLSPTLTAARAAYRLLPMGARREVGKLMRWGLEPALAARLPRIDPSRATPANAAQLVGLFSSPLGHGSAGWMLHAELQRAGVPATPVDCSAAIGAPIEQGLGPQPDTRTQANPPAMDQDAVILVMNPDTMVHALSHGRAGMLRNRRVIGYWVWELQTPPKHWRYARGVVHEIWTPSAFSAEAIRRDWDIPVRVVPHAAALVGAADEIIAREPARQRFNVADDAFVALSSFSLASSLARKNPFGAIRAFEDAFGADASCCLVLRALSSDIYPGAARALRERVRESTANILLIDQPQGRQELMALYAACDVYLSLHRSEGFGLNLAEAMLLERPVIATGWSGNLDFMTNDAAVLTPHRLIPVRDPQRIYTTRDAQWAEPDHDAAVGALRTLRSDHARRTALAQAGKAHALATLSGGAAAVALRNPAP